MPAHIIEDTAPLGSFVRCLVRLPSLRQYQSASTPGAVSNAFLVRPAHSHSRRTHRVPMEQELVLQRTTNVVSRRTESLLVPAQHLGQPSLPSLAARKGFAGLSPLWRHVLRLSNHFGSCRPGLDTGRARALDLLRDRKFRNRRRGQRLIRSQDVDRGPGRRLQLAHCQFSGRLRANRRKIELSPDRTLPRELTTFLLHLDDEGSALPPHSSLPSDGNRSASGIAPSSTPAEGYRPPTETFDRSSSTD